MWPNATAQGKNPFYDTQNTLSPLSPDRGTEYLQSKLSNKSVIGLKPWKINENVEEDSVLHGSRL